MSTEKETLPRVFKPDEDDFNSAVAQSSVSSVAATGNSKSEMAATRNTLKEDFEKLLKERADINLKRSNLLDQLKKIQSSIKKKADDAKSSKDKLNFKTVEECDRQIANLENQLSAGAVKLFDEKKIVQEISGLRKTRKVLEGLSSTQSTFEQEKVKIEELKKELDELDPQRKVINKLVDTAKAKKDEFESQRKEQVGSLSGLYDARNTAKALLDEEYQQIRSIRQEFKTAKDEFYNYQKQEREKKNQIYQQKKKEERLARLHADAEAERETALIPAFTEEITLCNNLIKHFQQYTPNNVSQPTTNGTTVTTTNSNIRQVDTSIPDGAVLMKKKDDREENFLVMGGKKGKKNRKPSATPSAASTKTATLRMDLNLIDQLAKLKVEIPATIQDLQSTFEALEAKKVYFNENQQKQTAENKKLVEEKIKALEKRMEEMEELEVAGEVAV